MAGPQGRPFYAPFANRMVLNQPALPKAQWRAEVEKMRNAYKAPIDPKDVDVIVDYLARTKGTK
jgi:hypothetical protein